MTKRLIDMYVKFGSLEKTKRIFYSMYNKNIVLWSTLLVGYAQFGFGEEALTLSRK